MQTDAWIALAILAAAATLFLTRKLPIGVTALLIPVALLLTGVVDDPAVALQGFGNHAVIALGSIFVVGAGLERTGVAEILARGIQRLAGSSETRLMLLITLTVAMLSAFMSNVATVAMLLPTVVILARRAGLPSSRLLMPLAFGAVLGGNLTVVGTAPNLLVSSFLQQETGAGFGMLDFAVVGLPIVLIGTLFLGTIGSRLLPSLRASARRPDRGPEAVARTYDLDHTLTHVRVTPQSPLCGRTLAEADLGGRYGLGVVIVMRPRNLRSRFVEPTAGLRIRAGDHLYLEGEDEAAWLLAEEEELQIGLTGAHNVRRLLRHGVSFSELTLPPGSAALGRSLKDLDFRRVHGLNVVAFWRRGKLVHEGMATRELEAGDFLLVSGTPANIRKLARSPDFLLLVDKAPAHDTRRAPVAVALLLLAVLPPLLGWVELAVSAMTAAALTVATGCLPARRAAQLIDWTVLLLIVGSLPLGQALRDTGVAAMVAGWLHGAYASQGDAALLGLLFLVAAAVGVTSSNTAAAVILAPIAARAAEVSGVPLERALLAVAYGCSCTYLVPFSQCNLMVFGPGGYRSRDFFVAGGVLSVVVAAVAVTLLSVL